MRAVTPLPPRCERPALARPFLGLGREAKVAQGDAGLRVSEKSVPRPTQGRRAAAGAVLSPPTSARTCSWISCSSELLSIEPGRGPGPGSAAAAGRGCSADDSAPPRPSGSARSVRRRVTEPPAPAAHATDARPATRGRDTRAPRTRTCPGKNGARLPIPILLVPRSGSRETESRAVPKTLLHTTRFPGRGVSANATSSGKASGNSPLLGLSRRGLPEGTSLQATCPS